LVADAAARVRAAAVVAAPFAAVLRDAFAASPLALLADFDAVREAGVRFEPAGVSSAAGAASGSGVRAAVDRGARGVVDRERGARGALFAAVVPVTSSAADFASADAGSASPVSACAVTRLVAVLRGVVLLRAVVVLRAVVLGATASAGAASAGTLAGSVAGTAAGASVDAAACCGDRVVVAVDRLVAAGFLAALVLAAPRGARPAPARSPSELPRTVSSRASSFCSERETEVTRQRYQPLGGLALPLEMDSRPVRLFLSKT
jgi:hypothetical protein